MSQQQHTQEPWRANDAQADIDGPNGDPVAVCYCNNESGDDAKANARRIVACVNACAGVPTELLETVAAFGGFCRDDMVQHVTKQRDDLQAELTAARNCLLREGMQRDTLLAALEGVLFPIEANDKATAEQIRKLYADEIVAANAAIASVKEQV